MIANDPFPTTIDVLITDVVESEELIITDVVESEELITEIVLTSPKEVEGALDIAVVRVRLKLGVGVSLVVEDAFKKTLLGVKENNV